MARVAAVGSAASQPSIVAIATKATKGAKAPRGAKATAAARNTAQTKGARNTGRTKAAKNSGQTAAATAMAQATAATRTTATTQATATTRTAASSTAVNRDSVSISGAARAMAQSSSMTGSQGSNRVVQAAAALSASQTIAVSLAGNPYQVSTPDLAPAESHSVNGQGAGDASRRADNGNNGNGRGDSVRSQSGQHKFGAASGSRLSAADEALMNQTQAAQRRKLSSQIHGESTQQNDASQMRAQFAESRAALMSSMVTNSGFRSVGTAVSSRSALEMFRAAGPTLSPVNAIAQYINSMLMETIGSNKGTGVYATPASGVAAASRVDLLG